MAARPRVVLKMPGGMSRGTENAKGIVERSAMQFRWAAAIALWTLLAGPVFDSNRPNTNPVSNQKKATPRQTSSLINHYLAGNRVARSEQDAKGVQPVAGPTRPSEYLRACHPTAANQFPHQSLSWRWWCAGPEPMRLWKGIFFSLVRCFG